VLLLSRKRAFQFQYKGRPSKKRRHNVPHCSWFPKETKDDKIIIPPNTVDTFTNQLNEELMEMAIDLTQQMMLIIEMKLRSLLMSC
jgi:hypothetical protein